jgi:Ser/Thr protein kinase RdoA (MazF antagonist)
MDHFSQLTPDRFLPALEESLGTRLTALARPLNSYVNRVYEVQAPEKTAYIAKFYRPGRWSQAALQDEHAFIQDCAEIDIPVVCPLRLKNGETLGRLDGIFFAVFPKRGGRAFDIEHEESWMRVGTLLGRLHNAGQKRRAAARLELTPEATPRRYAAQLVADAVTESYRQKYGDICARIIDALTPRFEGLESIRLHGDFHAGNILQRPGEGLMVIDFDDMLNGPGVQDLWLLLPDHYPASDHHLQLLLTGYRQFRAPDHRWPLLIEGLRAMRMIYFTAWCSLQRGDYQFQSKFPDWGSDRFWAREVQDLRTQYAYMLEAAGG